MCEHLAPLETEPVSVHAPYITYPEGHYRREDTAERRAALLEALHGVQLGAYDRGVLRWLVEWEISVVAVVVSLLWRVRHAAAQDHQVGGGSR
jgi:hypothetical protein